MFYLYNKYRLRLSHSQYIFQIQLRLPLRTKFVLDIRVFRGNLPINSRCPEGIWKSEGIWNLSNGKALGKFLNSRQAREFIGIFPKKPEYLMQILKWPFFIPGKCFFNQMPQQLPPVIGLKKKSAIIKGFECKTYFGAKSDFFNQIVF